VQKYSSLLPSIRQAKAWLITSKSRYFSHCKQCSKSLEEYFFTKQIEMRLYRLCYKKIYLLSFNGSGQGVAFLQPPWPFFYFSEDV